MIKLNHGFSLIELMISIALGLILTAGVIEIFVSNKLTYRAQQGRAIIQENARYAQHILGKEIRMAGFTGCGSLLNISPNIQVSNPSSQVSFTTDDVVSGFDGSSGSFSPALPAHLAGLPAAGTDVVTIHKASQTNLKLTSNMVQPNAAILVANRTDIQQGDIMFITDCDTADIFSVTNANTAASIAHGATGNTSPLLSKAYQTDAMVLSFESSSFYLKDTGRNNNSGTAIRSLFMQDINGTEFEIIEGVEDMEITYGIDTNLDRTADTYQTANAVSAGTNWPNVVSLNISLLLTSVNDANAIPQAYTFNGTSSTPTDRMFRRQWDYFISLRNRTL